MHDPWTVAFEIRIPFTKDQFGYKRTFLTIWHRDPEKNGGDDSCGWFRPHLDENDKKFVDLMLKDKDDNIRYFFGLDTYMGDMEWRLGVIVRNYKRFKRSWWRHPRWHIHHWRLQVHFLQRFKRWAFSRCVYCRKGFPWGYTPISDHWNSEGQKWFRSEKGIYHHECYNHWIVKNKE
jgi:hypothetical protein